MEVQAHAGCKPCHASDLSSFLSCWTMPGLDKKAREGSGQGAEGEVAAGHPHWSQPRVSVGLCQGAAALCPHWALWAGAGGIVPSPEQQGWPGRAPAPLSAAHSSHSSSPSTSRLSQLQSCPSRPWRCHPRPAPAPGSTPWPQLPAPAGGCSEPAMASSCPGSDFVGKSAEH